MKFNNKRGVSPVIATVLLILIVIILAFIVFLWARGFISEKSQKQGRAVELSCSDVFFEAEYVGGKVGIVNRGNIPIYSIIIKEVGKGEVLVYENLGTTITQGQTATINFNLASGTTQLLVVPVILGESKSGKVEFTCPDQYGYTISKLF